MAEDSDGEKGKSITIYMCENVTVKSVSLHANRGEKN